MDTLGEGDNRKTIKTLNEKKNGCRSLNGNKKYDRNDRTEQTKRAHSFYWNNRQVPDLNKKPSDFKSKILRIYL